MKDPGSTSRIHLDNFQLGISLGWQKYFYEEIIRMFRYRDYFFLLVRYLYVDTNDKTCDKRVFNSKILKFYEPLVTRSCRNHVQLKTLK